MPLHRQCLHDQPMTEQGQRIPIFYFAKRLLTCEFKSASPLSSGPHFGCTVLSRFQGLWATFTLHLKTHAEEMLWT